MIETITRYRLKCDECGCYFTERYNNRIAECENYESIKDDAVHYGWVVNKKGVACKECLKDNYYKYFR